MENNNLFYIKNSFVQLIFIARKWEVHFNRIYKKSNLTLKQFMLLLVLQNAFDNNPTIKDLSLFLSTSHQNTKVLLDQLEKKGFLKIVLDSSDKRVKRVSIIEKNKEFWEEREEKDIKILVDLFKNISLYELEITYNTLLKLNENAINN